MDPTEHGYGACPYTHGGESPCTDAYLAPTILALCNDLRPGKVLDIGCGNGALCRRLAEAGCQAVGIDPSETGIANARALVPAGRFYRLGVYDASELLPDAEFDAAISTEVIEHLVRPAALPQFAWRKLRRDGILIVSTPYHGYLKNLVLAVLGKWDLHHGALWEGGHIKFWSRRTLTALLESNGFRVVSCRGAGRLPFLWRSMVLVARKVD
jgi:2-polyprenyl-3-methyl-5-hydroxy-6-metoxy-1,4-benzoquinol methylase